jgi:hypothetical protein
MGLSIAIASQQTQLLLERASFPALRVPSNCNVLDHKFLVTQGYGSLTARSVENDCSFLLDLWLPQLPLLEVHQSCPYPHKDECISAYAL